MRQKKDPQPLMVAVYKPSTRGTGYIRQSVRPLFHVLKNHNEDTKILEYRATKTKANPKGDKDLKRRIKAFMPSGDYGEDVSRSIKNALKVETGMVQLDFDMPVKRSEVEALFNKYSWIAVAGQSCGGEGFYLLVRTKGAEHYDEYWQALFDFFSQTKYKVDAAVSSVNEIRYFSLTTDVFIREDATLWKKRTKVEVSSYLGQAIPHDSKLIKATTEGSMHYVDLVALAGLNNSNGVPKEDVVAYFKPSMFSKDSHLHKESEQTLANIVSRVYERYADQHGATIVPILRTDGITLPTLQVDAKSSQEYKAYQVVQNIFEAYLIKTDRNTKVSYRYNGKFWEAIHSTELRNFLSACAIASRMDARLCELSSFRDFMEGQLQDITACDFEVPLNRFNLDNGVIEFSHGKVTFTEHSDSYLFTYCLDYEYDPEAEGSKVLQNFLARTIPNEHSLTTFFQYVGSAFITEYKIELFLILLGGGANGKSTLINLIQATLGGSVGTYSLDKLTDPDGETSSKQARFIYNKVLGISPEDSRIKDPRLWRKIVSKEPIEVKALYKDTFETTNYARLISCMNETPYMDTVQGSARRLVVIPTGASLRRDEYDLTINTKLLPDRSAFLNMIIQGYKTTYGAKGAIKLSMESEESTMAVLDSGDNIIAYVKDRRMHPLEKPYANICKAKKYPAGVGKFQEQNKEFLSERSLVTKEDRLDHMYLDFRNWCTDEGITKILTKRMFAKRMRSVTLQRLGIRGDVHEEPFGEYMGADGLERWYYAIPLS